MASFSSDAFSLDAFSVDSFSFATQTASFSTFEIDQILNSQAVDGVGSYEICQRTGHKMLPIWHPDSKFIVDGYGDYVRAKSADEVHPQDKIASGRNLPREGPQSPESSSNSFIAVSIAAEDL